MRLISCKKCGARISNQYSYCTNCQALLSAKDLQEPEYSAIEQKYRSPLAGWLLSPVETKRGTKYKPTDTRQGALVGAFIGFISGIYAATIAYFIFLRFIWPVLTPTIIQSLAMTLPTLRGILIAAVVIAVPITSVVMGTILGVLFIVFREKLPGRTIIHKSILFSLILCLISFLVGLRSYVSPSRTSFLNNATLASLRSLQVLWWALSPVEFTLLGYLFGYLLNRRLKPR